MLGILATIAPPFQEWTPLIAIVVVACVVALGGSVCLLSLGSYPRSKGPERSLLYFVAIAGCTLSEYQRAFMKQDEKEYLEDILGQSHRLSEILRGKYWCLRWAYRLLFAGLVPWLLALYLGKTF